MADGILLKHGAGVDNTDLTAVSGDVLEGEKFLGADSKEAQMGAMKRITAVDKSMTVNETYNILLDIMLVRILSISQGFQLRMVRRLIQAAVELL